MGVPRFGRFYVSRVSAAGNIAWLGSCGRRGYLGFRLPLETTESR